MIQNDQVTVADVKARQMLTRILSVKDVLVDHKGRSPGLGRCAHSDLTNRSILAKNVIHLLGSDLVGQVAHKENAIHIRGQTQACFLLHGHLEELVCYTIAWFIFNLN
jgi:hypothetical protein